jgi:glyoxylase-like metal-dependent hydrolase (beta-lactamase superfamily II)
MRIINLTDRRSMIYSSNVYLILGDWGAIEDVNTLVDVGNDPAIMGRIGFAPTGVGKKAVEQVILTHGHFDHSALLPTIRESFAPRVYAHSAFAGADTAIQDGQVLRCGDRWFQVLHTPSHSDDSICLFCQTDGVLFVGDTPVVIRSVEETYEERFVRALKRLCQLDVRAIYFGHGDPITEGGKELIGESLRNVRAALSTRGR